MYKLFKNAKFAKFSALENFYLYGTSYSIASMMMEATGVLSVTTNIRLHHTIVLLVKTNSKGLNLF